MISALLAMTVFILLSTLAAAIGAEFIGWLPHLVRILVSLAVRQLPASQRARYREEFLSDIEGKAAERKLTALVWAIGTCLTAHGLARTVNMATPQKHNPQSCQQRPASTQAQPTNDRPHADPALAALLKRLREERGMTQEQLALDARIPAVALSGIERGRVKLSWETLTRIVTALGISVVELGENLEER
jgi:DNA-binding XRE family transcriptional regulator